MPVNPDALGPQARESQLADQQREFGQILYLTRKEIERRIAEAKIADCYIPSFSSRNIVYKGLMVPSQLRIF